MRLATGGWQLAVRAGILFGRPKWRPKTGKRRTKTGKRKYKHLIIPCSLASRKSPITSSRLKIIYYSLQLSQPLLASR